MQNLEHANAAMLTGNNHRSLIPLMPHKSLDTFFFWNSGSEAVEAAVKLARHATRKQNIIVMQGSYHGRTFGTMAMTRSKTVYGENYAPLMPGVFSVPFPYCKQCSIANCSDGKFGFENCCMDPVLQLELLLKRETAPSDTAAIFIEPVLGEGGYVPPPEGYLAKVREICDKNNILLVVDEVQSGFGRTGKMFAIEHWGVRPDILVSMYSLHFVRPKFSSLLSFSDPSIPMFPSCEIMFGNSYPGVRYKLSKILYKIRCSMDLSREVFLISC